MAHFRAQYSMSVKKKSPLHVGQIKKRKSNKKERKTERKRKEEKEKREKKKKKKKKKKEKESEQSFGNMVFFKRQIACFYFMHCLLSIHWLILMLD